ncbi:DUF4012 domain-containing protein [Patescibacteria group bacterium]|nr:DUF4012 domain-containing protein [Patescibacteria group bacterium]
MKKSIKKTKKIVTKKITTKSAKKKSVSDRKPIRNEVISKKKVKVVKSVTIPEKVEKVDDPFESDQREKDLIKEKKDISKINTVDEFLAPTKSDIKNADVEAINKIKQNLKFKTQVSPIQMEYKEKIRSKSHFSLFVLTFQKISDSIYNTLRIAWIKHKIIKKHKNQENFLDTDDIFAPQVTFLRIMLPYGWQKALVTFIVVAFLFVIPIISMFYLGSIFKAKDNVLLLSNQAYQHLKAGQGYLSDFDLDNASAEFKNASDKFSSAKAEINDLNFLTLAIINAMPEKKQSLDIGLSLLDIGDNLSNAGYYLLDGINSLFNDKSLDLTQKFTLLNYDISLAMVDIVSAQQDLTNLDISGLEGVNADSLDLASKELPKVEQKLEEFSLLSEVVMKFLGQDQWKRYLLVFQNNNEIRATGGFMGSYALMDIDRGRIKNMEIPAGGTYDLQGSLKVAVASPKPLTVINPRWEFHDSNWWPDFPTTAKKIIWFYENADGPTVDGVILITSSVMEDLLKVTGPVLVHDYNRIISYENFEEETQKIVELEYDPEVNRPKQFLADLAPIVLEKLGEINQKDFPKLIEVIYQNLQEKNIQFNFSDQQLQELVLAFNWGGEMLDTNYDYLSVISTNIAGAKTDAVVETDISHKAEILKNGDIIDTVIVTKKHNGEKGNIFTGVQNNDYLRVYVPMGSELLETDGFTPLDEKFYENTDDYIPDVHIASIQTNLEVDPISKTQIYNEADKTVFANWFQIKPGEEKSVYLKYKLPFTLDEGYSLLMQKQGGKDEIDFSSQVIAQQNLAVQNIYPLNLERDGNNFHYFNILNKDLFYGFNLQK